MQEGLEDTKMLDAAEKRKRMERRHRTICMESLALKRIKEMTNE